MIDNEIIKEIRIKSDIVDIIGNYIPLSKKGKNYFGVCPFHDDTNPSMSVSREKQIYTCFSCGATGNVITFVMDYEKLAYKEALSVLANKIGIDLKINTSSQTNNNQYKIYETLDKFYQNNINTSFGKKAKEYLTKRKIDDETIKTFGIGLSLNEKNKATKLLLEKGYKESDLIELGITNLNDYGINDVFVNRIMFPLCNESGNIVGYSGRIYDSTDDAKYVNTKETSIFKKGLMLYNYHRAKEYVREDKKIIVMEGFMDVIRSYTAGVKNVVAIMGTAVTSYQAKLIKKLSNEVYLFFDGDDAGEKATIACGNELLKLNIIPKVIRIDEGDPDSYILKYGKEKYNELFKNAFSLIDFKIEYYKKDLDLNNSVDLTKYIRELIREINLINDDILIELTLKKISNMVNVSYDSLKNLLDNKKPTPVLEKTIKTKKNLDKYEKAERILLYYMLTNEDVIISYRNDLPYLPSVNFRYLLAEILNYYEINKSIDVADFISFLEDKTELITTVGNIMEININEEYNVKEIPDCINALEEYTIKKEINRLQLLLKEEIETSKKTEIAEKITNLKMRSEKNDS